jgi:peptide/nickel transport system substrate-binding protein
LCVSVASCGITPGPAAAALPEKLTIGVPEGTVAGTDLGARQMMAALSLEGLTQLGEDGRALPRLAAKWQWENNGTRLRVTLRDGVTFHDGTPLKAELAAGILRDAIGQPRNRSLYPSFLDVAAINVEGDRELLFEVKQQSAFLPENLELPIGIGSQSVGTGPYRVVKSDASEIVLERFDKYHLGAPQIRSVVIRPFQTLRTAWTSLLRGDIDMVSNVPPEAVEFISNDDIQVVSFTRRYQYVVAFNSRTAAFRSAAVRRALNVAIDREALIKNVLQGRGIPATGPLWPKHWAIDSNVAAYRYDPGLATALLQGAGLKSAVQSNVPNARVRFTCLIPANFTLLERVALEVQRQLYGAGVDMQFEVVPIDEFNARIGDGRFEAMLIDLISGPTLERGYGFWRSARHFKGLNVFGYENAEAERIFDVLRGSANEAAVRSATSRLQQVLLDDPPALFLAWNERTRAVSKNFRIVQEAGRDPIDPIYTIWRWTGADRRQALANP